MKKFTIFEDIVEPYMDESYPSDSLTIAEKIELGMKKVQNGGNILMTMPSGIVMDINPSLENVLKPRFIHKLQSIIFKGFRTFRGDFKKDKRYKSIGPVISTKSMEDSSERIKSLEFVIEMTNILEKPSFLETGKSSGILIPVGLDIKDANFIYDVLMTGFEVYDRHSSK